MKSWFQNFRVNWHELRAKKTHGKIFWEPGRLMSSHLGRFWRTLTPWRWTIACIIEIYDSSGRASFNGLVHLMSRKAVF